MCALATSQTTSTTTATTTMAEGKNKKAANTNTTTTKGGTQAAQTKFQTFLAATWPTRRMSNVASVGVGYEISQQPEPERPT